MSATLDITETPAAADTKAVLDGLVAFNDAATGGPAGKRPLAVLLRDEAGNTVGGAVGASWYGWMYVELFHIPESFRGRGEGRRIMQAVEAEARARGLLGIRLDTFSFQAPGFYERLGFTRIGTIEDHPPGHARHWYVKRLGEG